MNDEGIIMDESFEEENRMEDEMTEETNSDDSMLDEEQSETIRESDREENSTDSEDVEDEEEELTSQEGPSDKFLRTHDNIKGTTFLLEPIVLFETPDGLLKDLALKFDDFIFSHPHITVNRICSKSGNTKDSQSDKIYAIDEVSKQLKEKKKGYQYSFSLANYKELDDTFKIPKDIGKIDLFSLYWPNRSMSKYLKSISKKFICYTKGYCSGPEKIYGGLCEWIYIQSGELSICLIEPTKINLVKHSSLVEDEKFIPQEGTKKEYVLCQGQFLYIPSSWISIRKCSKDNCLAIVGEFLNPRNLYQQLESFEQDVIDNNGKYSLNRDFEIRHLIWFSAINWLNSTSYEDFNLFDHNSLMALKSCLLNWKKLQKTAISPSIYAPLSIKLNDLCKDLSNIVSSRSVKSRQSLKNSENSINIISN